MRRGECEICLAKSFLYVGEHRRVVSSGHFLRIGFYQPAIVTDGSVTL
jgi:hypothetical protein